jgi:hypothetical protein
MPEPALTTTTTTTGAALTRTFETLDDNDRAQLQHAFDDTALGCLGALFYPAMIGVVWILIAREIVIVTPHDAGRVVAWVCGLGVLPVLWSTTTRRVRFLRQAQALGLSRDEGKRAWKALNAPGTRFV